jgi:hypothetical protein
MSGDTGAIIFVATQLDAREKIDSNKFDFRLQRNTFQWTVPGWNAYSKVLATYVSGVGCFRFSHPLFDDKDLKGMRIDRVTVRGEAEVVGVEIAGFPQHRMRPGPEAVGLGKSSSTAGVWYATHDTLHISWGDGYSMLTMDARVVGDSLTGLMFHETDWIRPNPPRVPVIGKRVTCNKR